VANHIAVERLTEKLGSHYIAPHGIADVYVNDKWVKASNAFNKTLCDRFNVDVLAFDGTKDAIFQAFNRDNNQFMEYVEDYGHFDDVPLEFIFNTFKATYPSIYKDNKGKEKIII
ncbi:MAG: transglutaminase, partial [Bacteroidota bacterium]